MFTVNRNPSHTELRKFGTAMLIGFTVIAGLLWFKDYRVSNAVTATAGTATIWRILAIISHIIGGALFGLSRTSLAATGKVYVAWMTATIPIGIFMSTIMLSVVYFVFLPIFSLIVRFNDPLRKKLHSHGTYWEDYKHFEPTLDRMRRLF